MKRSKKNFHADQTATCWLNNALPKVLAKLISVMPPICDMLTCFAEISLKVICINNCTKEIVNYPLKIE